MEPIRIPALYCPVKPEISPFVPQAIALVNDWILRFKLLSPDSLQHYHSQGFVHMTGRFYPKISLERLVALSKFFTLLFISDDQLDHSAVLKGSENCSSSANAFMSIIRGDTHYPPGSGNPELEAVSDCWKDIRELSPPIWRRQFTDSLGHMYKAAFWENANLLQGKPISLAEYLQLRQYLGAANIATDAIEFAYPELQIPVSLLSLPDFQIMVEKCRNTICWANDLFSLAKEQGHGGVHNLVLLLQKEHRISLERAISSACRKHDQDVYEFFSAWNSITCDGGLGNCLDKIAQHLLNLMRGNIDWSVYDTTRYHGFLYAEQQEFEQKDEITQHTFHPSTAIPRLID